MPRESLARKARSALVTLIPGTAARRKAIADLTARNIELAACVHERSILNAELAECRAGRAACEAAVLERDRRITRLGDEIASLRGEIASLGGEIDDLLGEIADLRVREDLTDQLLEAQARCAAAEDALRSLREAVAERARLDRDGTLRQPVLDFLALLAPHRAERVDLIRIGRERDGGYVMLDDFNGLDGALSCGIADETSWDRAIAERGIPVVQVDDSIDAPPDSHPLWTFHRRRVSAASSAGSIALRELIALCPGSGDTLIAKIDIEGSEWEALPPAIDSLTRCRQLVIEFHDFDRLADPLWRSEATAVLEAVVDTHCPVHVHGNNFEPLVVLGGVPVPKVCEVTFALRSRYRLVPAPGLVPTAMDCPNNPESADLHFALRYPTG